MKAHNYLTAVPFSFFSYSLYRDIGARWKGVGFAYLSILSFVSVVVTLGILSFILSDLIDEWAEETDWGGARGFINDFLAQTPDMMIDNDRLRLSPEAEQPYIMYLEVGDEMQEGFEELERMDAEDEHFTFDGPAIDDGKMPIIVFDLDADDSLLRESHIPILVTEEKILINNEEKNRIESYYISDFTDGAELPQPFMINADMAVDWGHQGFDWLLEHKGEIYAYIFTFYAIGGIIFAFVLSILYAICMGGIGVFAGFILRVPMTFGVAFRLACVALTPLIFFNIASFYFQGHGFGFLEQLAIVLFYMFFAVYSCKGVELQRS